MKRHLFAAVGVAALTVVPALAFAETKTLDVTGFHGVDVSSGIKATISGGQPYSVVVESGNAQDLADLRYEVRDGMLHLWYEWNLGNLLDWSGRDLRVTIGTEVLDTLEASAGALVEASALTGETIDLEVSSGAILKTTPIEGMFYSIEASSGGRIETSGLCETAEIEVSSGASIAAKDLDCTKVDLEASSGGALEVSATGTISAEVSTGGHVVVFGKPKVDKLETSTGGSIDFPG